MKQVSPWAVVTILIFSLMGTGGGVAAEKRQTAPREAARKAGRWAFAYQAFGNIPVNSRLRNSTKSGLGVGVRTGYGFGRGLSVEAEFQYDLLFEEGGSNEIRENKNLLSLAPGLRYTVDFVSDMSGYLFGLAGATYDYTENVTSTFSLNYAAGVGVDFGLTENLSIGPQVKYRHVIKDEHRKLNSKIDVQYVSIGVAMTYLYDVS